MRIPFKKNALVLIFPVLLASCAGGGSFDTDTVNEDTKTFSDSKGIENPSSSRNEDAQNSNVQQESESNIEHHLGYQVEIPRRNKAEYNENGELLGEDIGYGQIYDEDSASYKWVWGEKVNKQAETNLPVTNILERAEKEFVLTEDDKKNGFKHISLGFEYDDEDPLSTEPEIKEREEDYIVYYERRGPRGHIYYQGENASKYIPVGNNVTYQGIWHFVTNAERNRKPDILSVFDSDSEGLGAPGDEYGAVSDLDGNALGYKSEFNVNFNDKNLQGKLVRVLKYKKDENNKNVESTLYTIDGKVKNNRFSGSAKATPNNEGEKAYFHSDSKSVEGGFFGKNAEELAGSFLADDNTVFVVFGAKQQDGNTKNSIKRVDAIAINTENSKQIDLESFHDISKIIVDGKEIPLEKAKVQSVKLPSGNVVEVDAVKLDYVSLGQFSYKQNDKTLEQNDEQEGYSEDTTTVIDSEDIAENLDKKFGKHLFLQGLVTAENDIPTSSTVKYKGNWAGYFQKNGISPLWLNAENRSEFTVDFANKSLNGKLMRNSDLANQYVEIYNGKIDKNSFTGKAKTGEYGIYFDNENTTTGNKKIQFSEVSIEGGFYGPNAQELGGKLNYHSSQDKAIAVFGAKQTKESK